MVNKLVKFENLKNSKSFCLYPFFHLNLSPEGEAAPCFRSKPLSTWREAWNSKEFCRLRKQLLSGDLPSSCEACKQLEAAGAESYRQRSLVNEWPFSDFRSATDSFEVESGKMRSSPLEVAIRFSNRCNMMCPICSPKFSDRWQRTISQSDSMKDLIDLDPVHYADSVKVPDYNPSEALKEVVPQLSHLLISGGEPLIEIEHWKALEVLKARAQFITLKYDTNLSNLCFKGYDAIQQWNQFKQLYIKIGIDGDPLIYPHIRLGGNVKSLNANVDRLHQELRVQKILVGTMTLSLYNVERFIETAQFITELGLLFHTSQVQNPPFLSIRALPLKAKEALRKKIEVFLTEIEKELIPSFDCRAELWPDQRRQKQVGRIQAHAKSLLIYLLSEDQSDLYQQFLKHKSIMTKFNLSRLASVEEVHG